MNGAVFGALIPLRSTNPGSPPSGEGERLALPARCAPERKIKLPSYLKPGDFAHSSLARVCRAAFPRELCLSRSGEGSCLKPAERRIPPPTSESSCSSPCAPGQKRWKLSLSGEEQEGIMQQGTPSSHLLPSRPPFTPRRRNPRQSLTPSPC